MKAAPSPRPTPTIQRADGAAGDVRHRSAPIRRSAPISVFGTDSRGTADSDSRSLLAGTLVFDYVHLADYYTYVSKLTLNVDERVVKRAKRYAARRGKSVSYLVERYLDLVARPLRPNAEDPPVLRMLRGAAKGVDPQEYQRYLGHKYR